MKNIKRINKTDVEIDNSIYRKVEEPKPEFKVGDWVTGSMASWNTPVRIEKVLGENRYVVENTFNNPRNYSDSIRTYEAKYLRHATKDEIESHLKKICDERYPEGTKIKSIYEEEGHIMYDKIRYHSCYDELGDTLLTIYKDGKWAEIIPDKKKLPKTKDELREVLKNYVRSNKYTDEFLNDYE